MELGEMKRQERKLKRKKILERLTGALSPFAAAAGACLVCKKTTDASG